MVLLARYFCRRSQVARRAYGSIPDVGSSKKIVSDPPIKAIAQLQGKKEKKNLYENGSIITEKQNNKNEKSFFVGDKMFVREKNSKKLLFY